MSTPRRTHLDPLAMMIMVACCVVWGVGQVAAKVGLQSFPPLIQVGVRCLGAVVLLMGWSAWRGVPLFRRDGTLWGGLLAGALFAGEFAAIFIGLQYTSASRLTVFLYAAPFVVAVGMPYITHSERLRPVQWLGLALAFSGVATAFAQAWTAPALGPQQWWGDALGLLAALLWGGTTLTIRATALSRASAEKTLAYQLGLTGLTLTAAGWALGQRWPAWEAIAFWPGVSLLFQTVIVSFASFLVWFWLVGRYAATALSSFTLLTPVVGLICGVVLLKEPWSWQLLMALVGVALGIALVNRPARALPAPSSRT